MRLFKNKKGLNYSAFMVMVVLIAGIYLFSQVYVKLDTFETRIGDQELALLDVYNRGDKLLLFVDQSAKYSFYHALADLGMNGGFKDSVPCGYADQRPYWFKNGKNCYEDIDFYDNFENYFRYYLSSYFSEYPAPIYAENFEFVIVDDKLLGIPVKPVLLPIFTDPDKKEKYSEVMSKAASDLNLDISLGLGVYAVRPSFSVNKRAYIEDFELLTEKVDYLRDCVKAGAVDVNAEVNKCIEEIKSTEFEWALIHNIPDTHTYIFHVKFNNIENPYTIKPVFIRFALDF